MFKLLLLTAAIVIVSAGRIRRDAPTVNEAVVDSGINIAKDGVKKLEEIVSNVLSANSTDALLEKGGEIWDQVKNLANSIKTTTQEWSENTSVKELREIASGTVQEFKSEHPGLSTAVVESVDSLNKVANDIIVKLKLLADDKDVKDISNTLIDTTNSGITFVKNQLKDVTQGIDAKLHGEPIKDVAGS